MVYAETKWAIGRIFNDLDKYLQNEFDFTYYDWADTNPSFIITLMDKFDICITNLVNISHFSHISSNKLKKMTVEELIKALEKMPKNKIVVITEPDGIGWDNIGKVYIEDSTVKITMDGGSQFDD